MRALVTGGGGFLGRAICKQLVEAGWTVRSLNRGAYPVLEALGVEQHRGDIGDAEVVQRACVGVDVVFHTAAKVNMGGDWHDFYRTNVVGTEHVLEACRAQGVRRLVYTSTPSVVHEAGGAEGADESLPYATHFVAYYPATKAEAEKLVLAANSDDLFVCALRPHLVFGPGEDHMLPQLKARSESGQLRIIGDGTNLVDWTFVDDAARAHLLAAEALTAGPARGKAYFITAGAPVEAEVLINGLLEAMGAPRVERHVSPKVAYFAGAILERIHRWTGASGEPKMSRFIARQLSTPHCFDISAARKDLGFEPSADLETVLERIRAARA